MFITLLHDDYYITVDDFVAPDDMSEPSEEESEPEDKDSNFILHLLHYYMMIITLQLTTLWHQMTCQSRQKKNLNQKIRTAILYSRRMPTQAVTGKWRRGVVARSGVVFRVLIKYIWFVYEMVTILDRTYMHSPRI